MSVKVTKVRANSKLTCDHYIGREWGGFPLSPFHNPFHIGKDGNRAEVLAKFAEYWYAPDQWALRKMADMVIGDNDTLGCWCKPATCHGDIIAGYLAWKRREGTLW